MSPSNATSDAPASKASPSRAEEGITLEEAALALGLRRNGRQWRGPCPNCGAPDAFSLGPGLKRAVVFKCFTGCDRRALAKSLYRINLIITGKDGVSAEPPPQRRMSFSDLDLDPDAAAAFRAEVWNDEKEVAEPNADVLALLDKCRPARGTIVETYLRSRGIEIDVPDNILFCPNLKLVAGPAMVVTGKVWGYDVPIMASVTKLNFDGVWRPDRRTVRRCVGGWKRGPHIPLVDDGRGILGIGEGIETCLSAVQLGVVPNAWSAYCAENLPKIVLPKHREIWFLREHDPKGTSTDNILKAADALSSLGVVVKSVSPKDTAFKDFNDVLTGKRSE